MKNTKWMRLIAVMMVAAVLISACGPQARKIIEAKVDEVNPIRTININGTGYVALVPDLARINVGVRSEAKDVSSAVNANNKQAQAITAALIDAGIEEKDIQTANFNVYPQQQYDQQTAATLGVVYVVDNTLFITVRELSTLSKVLDAALNAGANQINNISFDVNDRQAAQDQARDLALKDAESKAQAVAETVGVVLGEVQTINVSNNTYVQPYDWGRGGAKLVEMDSEVPISAGQIVITYEVNMVYRISSKP